jgi:MFS family permease
MRRFANVLLLYAARAARGFGDGFAIIILPAYLSELGFGPFQIGVVASAALLGTAAVTLAIGFFARGRDLRNLSVGRRFCDSCDRDSIYGDRATRVYTSVRLGTSLLITNEMTSKRDTHKTQRRSFCLIVLATMGPIFRLKHMSIEPSSSRAFSPKF